MIPASRGLFRRFLGFDLRTGILLLVVFGIVRVALVLQANVTGRYQLVSAVFVTMAVLPWVVLTRAGRRKIGIVPPSRWRWMLPAAIAGAIALLAVYSAAAALWAERLRTRSSTSPARTPTCPTHPPTRTGSYTSSSTQ